MTVILNMLKQLLTSKKFVAMIAGLIVTLLAKLKFNVDPTTIAELVAMIVAFILGQGVADSGKEAAKINAVSAGANAPVPGATTAVSGMAQTVNASS